MPSIPKGIDDTLRSVMVLNLLGKEFKGLFNGTGYAKCFAIDQGRRKTRLY